MKSLQETILEKLKIRKSNKPSYKYFPETKDELKDILIELIKKRGNEGNFNDIDTSKITDMSYLFEEMKKFNGDISNWDVSKVTNMHCMFIGCEEFNQDISDWDVSNVKDMEWMFYWCKSFNQDLSNWYVPKATDMGGMFYKCPIEEKYKPNFS
jgi:surface protein